uniref:Uncharacterized protein n=1 Tax=Ditylenchus dipsaci TaxID=166011 RepID=A0A915DBT1_9BILA
MPVPRPSEIIGVFLLVIVNVFWVASSELTKYLFIDLDFKRPFFTTYAKSCMFSLFILRYACTSNTTDHKQESNSSTQAKYAHLESSFSDEDYEVESLTSAEFEPVQLPSSEVDSELEPALVVVDEENSGDTVMRKLGGLDSPCGFREVRRLPEKIAQDAKLARLPYRPPVLECSGCTSTSLVFNYIFYFAPLWFISSTTYQIALVYSSVSSVNLISTSSSLFVLILAQFSDIGIRIDLPSLNFPCFGQHFWSCRRFPVFLVIFWLYAVSDVSLLLCSLFASFSLVASKKGKIDINLIPTNQPTNGYSYIQWTDGSLFADYLWLYATLLTNSLISSLSLTLSIPMSMLADSVFRNQPPDMAQILASVPIMISFIGASFVSSSNNNAEKKKNTSNSNNSKASSQTRKQNVNPLNRVMVDADGGAERLISWKNTRTSFDATSNLSLKTFNNTQLCCNV